MEEYDLSEFGAVPVDEEDYDLSEFGAIPVESPLPPVNQLQNTLSNYSSVINQLANSSPVNFALGAGDALVNLPKQVANMISPSSMQAPLSRSSEGLAYKTGGFAGDIAGFLGGGSALNAGRIASKGLPYVGKLAAALEGGAGRGLARRGIGSALYGAAQSPEERAEGAALGGGMSVLSDVLLGKLAKFLPSPSRSLGKHLTPEQIRENVQIASGTNTPLGDVLESPGAKFAYENILTPLYGSGIDETTGALKNQLVRKGEDILGKYRRDTPPELVDEKLGQILKSTYEKSQKEKNKLYSKANELAKASNLKLDLPSFSTKAKEYSDIINDTNFLKFEPSSRKVLSKLTNYQNPLKENGVILPNGERATQPKYASLEEANILSGSLRNLSRKFGSSPLPEERYQAKILGDLSKSLKKDIGTSIDNSGDTALKEAYMSAEANYKKNFSPFLEKEIYKFLGGGESPEKLLVNFIKTGGTHDQASKIKKIMSALPEEGQDLFKYAYLSRALEGVEDARQVNPNKLSTNWGDTKLGPNQKKALFPNKSDRKELDDYSKLIKMNQNALHRMFNPHTGKRNSHLFSLLSAINGGALMGNSVAGIPGALIGGASAPFVMGGAAKTAANVLHSPKFREKMADKIINARDIPTGQGGFSDALKAALMGLTF